MRRTEGSSWILPMKRRPVSARRARRRGLAGPAPAPADDLFGSALPAANPYCAPKPGASPTGPQADFQTGLLLIDMRGGEKQPGRDRTAREPGEACFLMTDGSIVVHDDVADAAEWKRTTTVKAPEKPHHPEKPAHGPAKKPGAASPDAGVPVDTPTPPAPTRPMRTRRPR